MTARTFLVHGLLAGLLAGFAAFAVAFVVGEPQLQAAVDLEESHAALVHVHAGASAAHAPAHGDGEVVSRSTQRTWGLLTGSVAVGTALGGVVGLVAAGVLGRLGRLTPRQSTATVALTGFVAFALVPFLKYPANPPGVGSGDTIGSRTATYFAFVLISVVAAIAATVLGSRLTARRGAYTGVLVAAVAYLVVVVVAGTLLPSDDELGTFPADLLWYFRRASLATLLTMWGVLGVVLAGLVGREHARTRAAQERRAFAASL
ncbi:CbtA family protein [Nocardioides korecus]